MKVRQILFLGKNGVLKDLVSPPFQRPVVEFDSNLQSSFANGYLLFDKKPPLSDVQEFLRPIYKGWGRFGYLGDIVAIKEIIFGTDYVYVLDYIGRLSTIKPALAVDLMLVVVTANDNYLVGIKRGNEPGKGKLAFPGGFIDVKGFHLETPIETIVHEAEEEIGLQIKVLRQTDLKNYLASNVLVAVDYYGQDIAGELICLGTFPTGDSEKLETTGLKRVYTTTAYTLILDMAHTSLDGAGISDWLKAGDDASELVIINLKDSPNLEFGLEHHQMLYDRLAKKWSLVSI